MRKVAHATLLAVVACGFHPSESPDGASVGSDSGSGSGSGSATGHCDAVACVTAGGTCNPEDECQIHITTMGMAPSCPPAMKCHISCDAQNTCDGVINCGQATACVVDCNMQNTCMNSMATCPNGCTFYCRDQNTCRNADWSCGGTAAACTLECCAMNTCSSDTANGTFVVHDPGVCP